MATHLETLKALDAMLRERRKTTDLFEAYYAGNHRLAYATEKYKDAFGSLFGAWADNWCGVVADTPVERLAVEGIKVDGEPNPKAWDIWHDNDMELHAATAMLGAVKTGHSYVLVDRTEGEPAFYVWPSSMAIVKRDPKTRLANAGLTTWVNEDGTVGAEVYLPEGAQRFHSKDKPKGDGSVTSPQAREWKADGDLIPNVDKTGAIPLVEITNRPNELGIGRSDLADVIALQDAINKLSNDMIIASEFQAFRQRVLTGVEIPKNPETGEPLPSQQIEAAMSRLWAFEPAEAKVYDLDTADLSNWVAGIKELLNHLAAQTRTPPHYLIGQMVNVSGEALTAAESGLVSRVEAKQRSFKIAWREVLRLAGVDGKIEVIWKNPERRSLSALADGITKLAESKGLALPRENLWAILGYSPLEIEEMLKSPIAQATAATLGGDTSSAPTPPMPPAPPAPPAP